MKTKNTAAGPLCRHTFGGVKCALPAGHEGKHQAEFPRYHCHVNADGKITPDVEQPFRWPFQ